MSPVSRRRLLLSSAALLLPSAARTQQANQVYRVVYLTTYPPQRGWRYTDSLKDALRDRGFVEERDFVFERRDANGDTERIPEVARQVVAAHPDVIVTAINVHTRAARQATSTIPIVMVVGTDVIREGFVASLARPGGNITGASWDAAGAEIAAKRIEFLRELLPGLSRVAGLLDTGQDAVAASEQLKQTAAKLGLEGVWFEAQEDLEPIFAAAARSGAQALLTGGGARLFRWRRKIAQLSAKYRMPDAHYDSAFVDAGGLMSYAPSLAGLFYKAGDFVARILRGADPATLPIEQPTQLELVLNLKTARALNITVPQPLLLRADRLIQ